MSIGDEDYPTFVIKSGSPEFSFLFGKIKIKTGHNIVLFF